MCSTERGGWGEAHSIATAANSVQRLQNNSELGPCSILLISATTTQQSGNVANAVEACCGKNRLEASSLFVPAKKQRLRPTDSVDEPAEGIVGEHQYAWENVHEQQQFGKQGTKPGCRDTPPWHDHKRYSER